MPATLILLFSVVVPFVKTALVGWAVFVADEARRRRTLTFVEAIAKWSMADVFVVALFITYLAAMASQSAPAAGPPLLAFIAEFGAGFYWFAAYCLFSLASQQLTARVLARGCDRYFARVAFTSERGRYLPSAPANSASAVYPPAAIFSVNRTLNAGWSVVNVHVSPLTCP